MKKKLSDLHLMLFREFDLALEVERELGELDNQLGAQITEFWQRWVQDNLGLEWDHCDNALIDGLIFAKRTWVPGEAPYDDEDFLAYCGFYLGTGADRDKYWLQAFFGDSDETWMALGMYFDEMVTQLGDKGAVQTLTKQIGKSLTSAGFKESKTTAPFKKKHFYEKVIRFDRERVLRAFETGEYDEAFTPLIQSIEVIQSHFAEVDRIVEDVKRMKSAHP